MIPPTARIHRHLILKRKGWGEFVGSGFQEFVPAALVKGKGLQDVLTHHDSVSMKTLQLVARILPNIFFIALLVGLPINAQETREFPPNIDWQQIETRHFRIVFDDAWRSSAEKAARMIEPIHAQVTDFLGYAPKSKTTVVLTDHLDEVDAYITPLPNNRIVVYLREPGAGDAFFGLRSPDWLAVVLTHEYTHIVHLDMVNGFSAYGRNLLGRIVLPNGLLDGWIIEGLAVYAETRFQDGRGRHSSYDMYMRADVLDDTFKRIDQLDVNGRTWPKVRMFYLYGYQFLQYLADTYGEETLVELNRYNSHRLPWQKNIFKNVYGGRTLASLWGDWREAMQKSYRQQIAHIRLNPVTRTTPVSFGGYGTNSPAFSPDGAFVYYIDDNPHALPALVQYRVRDGHATRLTEGDFSGGLSVSPDGRTVYFCQNQVYRTFSMFSDIYALHVATGAVRRLTDGLRAFDPAVSPDGRTLAFTTTQAGSMALRQMDLETGTVTALWTTDDHTQIGRPAFSPDGSQLAVHAWVEGGFQDIYVMNRAGGSRRALTFDKATDSSPAWSADGAYVYFSSDRTGVSNIFAYNVETDTLDQVTNVLTGAFHPAISPDDERLALELYSSAGMNIHLTEIARVSWQAIPFEQETLPQLPTYRVAESGTPLEVNAYSPFPSVFPRFWLPGCGADEAGPQLGVMTFGNDLLGDHTYSLSALYGLQSGRFSLFGSYTNQQFYPAITLYGSDNARAFGDIFTNGAGETKTYWQQAQSVGLNIAVPLHQTRTSRLTLDTGYRYTRMHALSDTEALTSQPDDGALSGISVGLAFNNLQSSEYAIAPERGLVASVMYRRDDTELGSDFTLDTVVAETRAYVEIPKLRHHVLALRMAGGASQGDTLSQGLFQVGGNGFESGLTSLEQRRYALRGYDSGAFSGNRFALGSAEYRRPLWYPQRGFNNGMVFFDSIVAAAFYDVGYAWDGDVEGGDFKHSVGGDLRINVNVFGRKLAPSLPLMLRIGYAHALDEDEGASTFTYGFGFNVWL